MKRIIHPLLAVCALLLAQAAAAQSIRLTLRDTTVVGGTTFSYPITVDSSLTGKGVTSYEIELTFNQSYLTFVGATKTGTMTQPWDFTEANEISAGRIRVAGSGSDTLSGTGKLVFLQFQAKVSTFQTSAFVNFFSTLLNEGTPATTTDNGVVTIQVPPFITVSPDTWLMTKGETRQFTVSQATGPTTWSTTDPSKATINSTGLLTAVSAGLVRVVCTDSLGIVDTSGIIEIRALKLSISDSSVFQGQTLDLSINTTSVTGLGITSGQMTVTFNQSLWTATGVVVAGTILSASSPEFSSGPGWIAVSFAGSTPIAGSGTLMKIRLVATTQTYGSSSISFSNMVFNEDISANSQTGSAGVLQLATLNVTPSGTQNLVKGDSLQFSASGGTAPYTWSVSDSQKATISPSGILRVLRGGTVTVSAKDANGAFGSSGTVNLFDFRLRVPNYSQYIAAAADTTVEFHLTVTSNDTGFLAFQFNLTYSTAYTLVLDSVITTGTLSNGWSVVSDIGSGSLTVAAAGTNPVTASGTLVKLRFRVPGTATRWTSTWINLSNVLFNEGSPLPLVQNGSLHIRDTNAKPTLSSRTPSSLDSTFTGSPTVFSVNASDPDGDALTYHWKVNGVVEQSGSSSTFSKLFTSNSANTTVTVVFQDPFGLKDSTTWSFKIVTSVLEWENIVPEGFLLLQNYPNPFNPSTVISYQLSSLSTVRLVIYNSLGEEVTTLVNRELPAGLYRIEWNAAVPSGVYFYRLEALGRNGERFVQSRKMVLLR